MGKKNLSTNVVREELLIVGQFSCFFHYQSLRQCDSFVEVTLVVETLNVSVYILDRDKKKRRKMYNLKGCTYAISGESNEI